MRWTELLQEVRQMRFEEAYGVGSVKASHRRKPHGFFGFATGRFTAHPTVRRRGDGGDRKKGHHEVFFARHIKKAFYEIELSVIWYSTDAILIQNVSSSQRQTSLNPLEPKLLRRLNFHAVFDNSNVFIHKERSDAWIAQPASSGPAHPAASTLSTRERSRFFRPRASDDEGKKVHNGKPVQYEYAQRRTSWVTIPNV